MPLENPNDPTQPSVLVMLLVWALERAVVWHGFAGGPPPVALRAMISRQAAMSSRVLAAMTLTCGNLSARSPLVERTQDLAGKRTSIEILGDRASDLAHCWSCVDPKMRHCY